MAVCKDPLRTSLNDKGYNVILLPRQGIEPMDVLGKEDTRRIKALNVWERSVRYGLRPQRFQQSNPRRQPELPGRKLPN
jgi:hypothetical protein